MKKISTLLLTLICGVVPISLIAQRLDSRQFTAAADSLQSYFEKQAFVLGKISVSKAVRSGNTLTLSFTSALSEYPFREETVNKTYEIVRSNIPSPYKKMALRIESARSPIEDFIPPAYKPSAQSFHKKTEPRSKVNMLVSKVYSHIDFSSGLKGNHIALWQSHGYYYEQKLLRWEWQRARIFQTVEDLYTQSYVLPFLVPMLENAGAYVLMPRERDIQLNEIIVDNDIEGSGYKEITGSRRWNVTDSLGFASPKEFYLTGENPFRMGTARVIRTTDKVEDESSAIWTPHIKETGEYAVYVSYQTLPRSTTKAKYTVHHSSGDNSFFVNQNMGGGTWIYLGTFHFVQGAENQYVSLSNFSEGRREYVSADAVKFGGGFGNIARKPAEDGSELNIKSSSIEPVSKVKINLDVEPVISGYPRFTEGARYWLQWAGFSDTIYSPNQNANDYNDDYMSRGKWVNVISGGSTVNPEEKGLNIPVDLAFAFHTDAGTTRNDSIIGTLGIYTRGSNGSDQYPDGRDRIEGRYLTDMIQTQIVDDIQSKYEPLWQRRGIWDRSYSESRSPNIPSMLLELLSHQNLADMRYGLDPEFRFTVSRAIYKGMLKYLSASAGKDYVVQPLPVKEFSASLHNDVALLTWRGVEDTLEATASPEKFVLYTRIGDLGFDNGRVVEGNSLALDIEEGTLYSFKVTAINKGGESFPSEILSLYNAPDSKGTVLIVNGFTRVSAPSHFATPDTTMGGFSDYDDNGVPYLKDISYIGSQYEFRREIPWMDDDSPGFGASYGDYETKVISGNTFDFTAIHGQAFAKMGYSFVSTSREAVEQGSVDLKAYNIVDFIMGKQRQYKIGRGLGKVNFKVFTPGIIKAIEDYSQVGGNILISGSYIATDVWDSIEMDDTTKKFVQNTLKYEWRTNHASRTGYVKSVQSPYKFSGELSFHTTLNQYSYTSESPDGLEPRGEDAWTIFRYADNNISAGVAYKGNYSVVTLGFPIETIKRESDIDALINQVINFFNETNLKTK
ncbi:MAG: N-acetylmuramoyl-L-alanine amidase [Bacteroidales bacterium]|nr:N-acetylmuramoyl-L-alanine amidase [Bacteroidales bacterium]